MSERSSLVLLRPPRLSSASNSSESVCRQPSFSASGSAGSPQAQSSLGSIGIGGPRRRLSDTAGSVFGLVSLVEETEDRRPRLGSTLFDSAGKVLRNPAFSCLMTAITIFVLVGDDLRLLCFGAAADNVFNWLTCICFVLFAIEVVLSSLTKEDYLLGFWFFCDIIAAASLVFDLTFVSEAIMGYQSISAHSMDQGRAEGIEESEYARASRASRVGARVARFLRVVRLVRLSRILQQIISLLRFSRSRASTHDATPGDFIDLTETQGESRVGRKLSERTTQRVIMIVLVMLLAVPHFTSIGDHETMMSASAQYGANVILQAWQEYELAAFASNSSPGLVRQLRKDWEEQLLTYVYYHNRHDTCQPEGESGCADQWLQELCWVGFVRNHQKDLLKDPTDVFVEGYIQLLANETADWDSTFSGNIATGTALYSVGSLPDDIKVALTRPWDTRCIEKRSEEKTEIVGVSLIQGLPCPRNDFRLQETAWYVPSNLRPVFIRQHMEGQFLFVFDMRKLIQLEAVTGILQTVFVVVVLAFGALLFSRDVDKLVLLPIERMISKVEIIRQDPLFAIRLAELQYMQEKGHENFFRRASELFSAAEAARGKTNRNGKKGAKPKKKKKNVSLETKILENAIIKLGSLLALGFGEAGSEIIGHNLDDDNDMVDALVPGSKVEAIYGWCGIRKFGIVTDVLQENTMVFVNQVADIVHRIVDEHLGAANKNVGEAFLLVWQIGLYEDERQSKVADLAVMSFVQVIAELSKDRQLAEYREHPALLARIPNFRVSLGFSLHLGWSIEGAIGSEFKIDASYLSPHVNIACNLEAVTLEYGVKIIMGEPLVRCCNTDFSRHFRPIDHVKLQGSKTAMRLFTVDLDSEVLPVASIVNDTRRKSCCRFQDRLEREQWKAEILHDSYHVCEVFTYDTCVRRMRERFVLAFFQEFERGYLNYEAGEWDVAAQVLGKTKTMLLSNGLGQTSEDGPSRMLLEYMRGFDFEAPSGWPGWRELREK